MKQRRAGGSADLRRAFLERASNLRAIARRVGRQDEEDVVQDAFVRIIERSQSQEIRAVDNLLSRIVRCFAIDRLRRRTTRSAFLSAADEEEQLDLAVDPERALMGAQRLKRVLAAIESMPPRRREVFLLHRVEERTYAQIARQLGVSIKSVEKHMHLAMRQLSDTDD